MASKVKQVEGENYISNVCRLTEVLLDVCIYIYVCIQTAISICIQCCLFLTEVVYFHPVMTYLFDFFFFMPRLQQCSVKYWKLSDLNQTVIWVVNTSYRPISLNLTLGWLYFYCFNFVARPRKDILSSLTINEEIVQLCCQGNERA